MAPLALPTQAQVLPKPPAVQDQSGGKSATPRRRRGRPKFSFRKDLPKRASVQNAPKPTLKRAVDLAKSKTAMERAVKGIEDDYFSNSSKASKAAKRHAIEAILKSAFPNPFSLSVKKLKALAGTLRDAGYKSANISRSFTSREDGNGPTFWTGISSCASKRQIGGKVHPRKLQRYQKVNGHPTPCSPVHSERKRL